MDFTRVPDNVDEISEEVTSDLLRDQKLLYRYIKAVSSGTVPPNLVTQGVPQSIIMQLGLPLARWVGDSSVCIL